jgi:hypothetical protein
VTAYGALGARLLIDGAHVGDVTGVLLDKPDGSPIGLEVTSATAERRFLPWAVANAGAEGIVEVPSALLLVDSCDAYVTRGAVICRAPATATSTLATEVSGMGSSGTRTS